MPNVAAVSSILVLAEICNLNIHFCIFVTSVAKLTVVQFDMITGCLFLFSYYYLSQGWTEEEDENEFEESVADSSC